MTRPGTRSDTGWAIVDLSTGALIPTPPPSLAARIRAHRDQPQHDPELIAALEREARADGDPELLAQALLLRSDHHHRERSFADGWRLASEAESLARDPLTLGWVAKRRARMLTATGLRQRAVEAYATALRHLEGHATGLELLEARFDAVTSRLEAGLPADLDALVGDIEASGDERLLLRLGFARMRMAFRRGDLAAAEGVLRDMEGSASVMSVPSRLALVQLNLGTLALLAEAPCRAHRLASTALAALPQLLEAHVLLARAHARTGDLEQGRHHLHRFLMDRPSARSFGALWAYARLTDAALSVAGAQPVGGATLRALQRIEPTMFGEPALEGLEARRWAEWARQLAVDDASHGPTAAVLTSLAGRLLHDVPLVNTEPEARGWAELRARSAPVPLGPWAMTHELARGGQGEVWRARHLATGQWAAVKVMTAPVPAGVDPMAEAEAVARLDHPGIVALLDHGVVSADATMATDGRWPTGAPWMAMELVDGGSLRPHCGRMGFDDAKQVLLTLLDALAHAHARGVLHLDIKPHNVLLRPTEQDLVAALTDFGIARARDDLGAGRVAGTPAYMSPEQCRGQWRALGPATDLYSLGALTYHLLTGAPPFRLSDPQRLRKAHFFATPPPLVPALQGVPQGMEDWAMRLLAKEPRQRFPSAAHAAMALRQVVGSSVSAAASSSSSVGGLSRAGTTIQLFDEPDDRPSQPGTAAPTAWPELPAMPLAVQVGRSQRPSGARLLAPSPPLTGRDDEKAWLWRHFVEVASSRRSRRLAVTGPAGVGTTAVASWVGERAAELGARWLRVPQGLRRGAVVEAWLRTTGLSGTGRATQAAAALDRFVDDPLVARVVEEAPSVDAVMGLLEAWSSQRPVVVSFDERCDDWVEVWEALRGAPMAVLAVDATEDPAGAPSLDVQPLGLGAMQALLDHAAPLERALRDALAVACRGLPGPALQQLDAWRRLGLLQPGPRGERLPPGHPVADPLAVSTLRQSFRSVAGGPAEVEVVRGAAGLGRWFDEEALVQVAAACGVAAPVGGVVDRMVAERLWQREPMARGRVGFVARRGWEAVR
jgi:hypothetical protein